MQIRHIFYDLDGVLVDACDWHYESLNRALNEVMGFTISRRDHISKYNGLPTNVKLDLLKVDSRVRPSIWRKKQDYTKQVIRENAIKDLIKVELHEKMRDHGIECSCVTNSIKETAEMMLSSTGQVDFMNNIISNEDVAKPKPDPEPYRLAMLLTGLDPERCLIVEDSPKGVESAIASGAHLLEVSGPNDVNYETVMSRIMEIENERTHTYGR